MTNEEARKEYLRKWRYENRESRREYLRKWRAKNREEYNERQRMRKAENIEEHKEYVRKHKAKDINSIGITKNCIRTQSNRILLKTHSKLKGYEIHHCFGYDDPNNFIYIPRAIHLKIHQLLRDHKIQAESYHWNVIRDLVNSCEDYTYIRI